jgi:DNA repair photolyase
MIDLADIKTVYLQDTTYSKAELTRLRTIGTRLRRAGSTFDITKVKSHWKIPQLAEVSPLDWITVKKQTLVVGKISNLTMTESFRSTDFIPPSHANGCFSSCQYCYTARRKGNSNPVTLFVNTEDLIDSIVSHSNSLGPKEPNQCDAKYWTYDIGNNNDVSLDLMLSDIPLEIIEAVKETKQAKLSFATKTVNIAPLLSLDPKDRVRVRYSLMPQPIAKYVDIRTSPIVDRINAINTLVDAGYEVHLNFSPIIVYSNMEQDWIELFSLIDSTLSDKAKKQLACEIIFLTHNKELHDINMQWNPKGESFLWAEDKQQTKFNKPDVICYKYELKKAYVQMFSTLVNKHLPYCKIRYAF